MPNYATEIKLIVQRLKIRFILWGRSENRDAEKYREYLGFGLEKWLYGVVAQW